ncbi:MAG TPA: hypothetical protein VHQ98_12365 [Gaiellaceae bacterium]|jgi:hypothetical protein|nr:hypothetical protein [Gaiellaceae bacterium]
MAWQANGRAAGFLESDGRSAERPSGSRGSSPLAEKAQVYEAGDALVVHVRLAEGPLELRIPKAAVDPRRRHHRIPGCNPDATPC